MNADDLEISPEFLLAYITGPAAKVTDVFNYPAVGIANSQVKGNVIAKRGAVPIHSNISFLTPDINRASTDNVQFALQVDSQGKVINGAYDINYTIQITDEVLYRPLILQGFISVNAPGATPFATITLGGSIATLVADMAAIVANYSDKRVVFYDSSNVVLGESDLTGATDTTTITFDSVNITDFADIAKIRILGTNEFSKDFSYSFCNQSPTVCIDVTHDCLRSQLTAVDKTNYPGNLSAAIVRTMVLGYPRGTDQVPVESPITTSDAAITIGPDIWSGGYSISVSTVLQWTGEDGLIVTDTVVGQNNHNVSCKFSLCGMRACINSLHERYIQAQREGALTAASLAQQNVQVLLYVNRFNIAVQCADTEGATAIMVQLATYLEQQTGCDCGCSDCNDTQSAPQIIYATVTSSLTSNLLSWN